MTNIHIIPGELTTTDTIEPELHYGPYLRDCCLQPGFVCEGSGQSSSIMTSSSAASTSVYQTVFGTKTKIARLSYLGLEQPKTFQKLLKDITFRPFIVKIENLSIFVSSLGKITRSNHSVKQTGILRFISSDSLFAINHPITLQNLDKAYKTRFFHQQLMPDKCTLANWDNRIIMEYLFDLHLKKAVSKFSEEWYQVFQNWKQQKNNIIELYTHLSKIYGSNYEFQEREMRVWRVIFCATGCTKITPYNKQFSK
ncbi:6656_t:CDS:2, partial [Racocetra persica]